MSGIADLRELFKKDKDDIEVKKKDNDIFIYILIFVIIVFLQFKTLIVQYIFIVLGLFFFSVRTGIMFASILFLLYNYDKFFNHYFLKWVTIPSVIFSLIGIILDNFIENGEYLFVSLLVMNIITILANIYCIFVVTRDEDLASCGKKDKNLIFGGGINLNKINLNFRK